MELNFPKFDTFLDSVKKITKRELLKAKELLATEGKDITALSDIIIGINGELFDTLPDGTIVKVNLYIAVKSTDRASLNYIKPKDIYKYHIYKCSTISQMFDTGRKHRYKINNRDDGTFFYTFNDYQGRILSTKDNQKLNICKNCLKRFLQKQFASDYDVENFDLKEFHIQNSSIFGNINTSSLEMGEDAKPNEYTGNWREVSNKIKQRYDYTCQNCGWKAKNSYEKSFIHTHHQNGDKQNNRDENLRVLCIKCHSQVDIYHKRIQHGEKYREYISIIT